MRRILMVASLLSLLAGVSVATAKPAPESLPAGTYILDNAHTSIIFKISHWGFSHFTGRFDKAEGSLDYSPDAPNKIGLVATIYPNSIDTNSADLDEDLRGNTWFDVIKYPKATFNVTRFERTGENTARVTGDFTLRGITHPLVLTTELIGAGKMPITGHQVMGFSARGSFSRADYGMRNLEPMIGDDVTLEIESEFQKE